MNASGHVDTNRSGWLRMSELPWSASITYDLIKSGDLETARLTIRGVGKDRGIRLISQRSVDKYLSRLAAEQALDPLAPKRWTRIGRSPNEEKEAA
jgi:hypothetical protein